MFVIVKKTVVIILESHLTLKKTKLKFCLIHLGRIQSKHSSAISFVGQFL